MLSSLGLLILFFHGASCQTFNVIGLNSTQKRGEAVPITCLYEDLAGVIVISVVWEQNGETIFTYQPPFSREIPGTALKNRSTGYNHTSTSTTLYIGNSTEEDKGAYICNINPSSGTPGVATALVELIYVFDVVGQNTKEQTGNTLSLSCWYDISRALAIFEVVWKKMTDKIFTYIPVNGTSYRSGHLQNRITNYDHKPNVSTLHIGNATATDEGSYTCSFRTREGIVVGTVSVTVIDNAKDLDINVIPTTKGDIYEVYEGDSFALYASIACAKPGVDLSWSIDSYTSYKAPCEDGVSESGHSNFSKMISESDDGSSLLLLGGHESFKNKIEILRRYRIKVCKPEVSREVQIALCVVFAIIFVCGAGIFGFFLYRHLIGKEQEEKKKCYFIGIGAGVTVAAIAVIVIAIAATRKTTC